MKTAIIAPHRDIQALHPIHPEFTYRRLKDQSLKCIRASIRALWRDGHTQIILWAVPSSEIRKSVESMSNQLGVSVLSAEEYIMN